MSSDVFSLVQKTFMLQVLITVKDQDLLGAKFMGKVHIRHFVIQKLNAVKYPQYPLVVLYWNGRSTID